MKRLILLIFCLGSTLQAQNLDSLWQVWDNHSLPDTTRVKALNKYTRAFYVASPGPRVLTLTDSVINFAHQCHQQRSEAMGYMIKGLYLNRMGEYENALQNYRGSEQVILQMKDTNLLANLCNNIATTYCNIGDLDKAENYYNYCITLSKLQLDTTTLVTSYINISEVLHRKGNSPKALFYLQQVLLISEMTGDEESASMACMNLGSLYFEEKDTAKGIYYNKKALVMHKKLDMTRLIPYDYISLAGLYEMEGKNDLALYYYREAIKLAEQSGEKELLGNAYIAVANNYKNNNDFQKALQTLDKVFLLNIELGHLPMIAQARMMKGQIHLKQKNYKGAVKECLAGYDLSTQMKSLEQLETSCECLATAYEKTGDYKNSSRYYKEFIAMKDSINTDSKIKEFTELRMQYDFDKEQLADSINHMQEQSIKDLQIEKHKSNLRLQAIGLGFAAFGIILTIILAVVIYKGKKRSDELLLNILPYETAQELKKKGYADAKQFDQVSVMFTDFKGFTGIAEKLSAKQLVAEINECFKVFDQIMGKYGIEKIKTIGDAYMAACGLPVTNPQNAVLMVKAALEIRDFMNNRKAFISDDGTSHKFHIRIGIHSGPVVAGIVGIKKFQYDIWGDTVNLASRMESSGEPGKVNISADTFQLVKDQFSFESRGEIEAKGKGKIQMYFTDWLK